MIWEVVTSSKWLWRVVARQLNIHDEAVIEDVGLETTLRCAQLYDASKGEWPTYLGSCLRFQFISYLEGRRDEPLLDVYVVDEDRKLELRDEVQSIMQRATEEERVLLLLRHWAGMTVQEVADEMGISKGEASKRLRRTYARLAST